MDFHKVWVGTRAFWSEWTPRVERDEQLTWPIRKGPSAFYAVKRGRTTGIFDKWSDCRRSVVGLVDSVFCGCLTLAEAWEWLRRV